MRGSWKSSIKIAGEANELIEVAGWLTRGISLWPSETLAWLVVDASEPTWVQAFDLFLQAERRSAADRQATAAATESEQVTSATLELAEVDLRELRQWRAQISKAAEANQELEVWSHSAPLDGAEISFQVHGTDIAGRWSGFTLASFGEEVSAQDSWIRFDPQETSPCRSWVVVVSNGLVLRTETKPDESIGVEVEQRDMDNPEELIAERGAGLVQASSTRLDLALRDVSLDASSLALGVIDPAEGSRLGQTGSRLKSFDGSMDCSSGGKHKLRIAGRGVLAIRPRVWNLLSPFWPVVRMVTKRKARKHLSVGLDKTMTGSDWRDLVALARLDDSRRKSD